ncbi:unnamed protein product [Prunus armeniaca]|uniref:Uncharacterized protein n=1 Tax=Prunus armeniaca TaxID=36596 RepID=A0A6J5VZ80_PRUAR|nr:unnamed protein product [Prunus armeniaca]
MMMMMVKWNSGSVGVCVNGWEMSYSIGSRFGNSMMMAKVVMINFRERGIKEDEGLDAGGNGEEEKRR